MRVSLRQGYIEINIMVVDTAGLSPCACAFPPGFSEHAEMDACSTHTITPDTLTQQVQTCASEQGATQLADDVRAETHTKTDEIRDLIVDLQNTKCFRCRDVQVGELQNVDRSVEKLQLFDNQEFHDMMQFDDQSLGGAPVDVQVEGTADNMK